MIQLNRVLDGLEIEVQPFAVCEIRPGAGLEVHNPDSAHMHYVLHGEGIARSASGLDVRLRPHSVLVVPAGVRETLLSPGPAEVKFPEPRCQPVPGGWDWIEVGEGDAGLAVACANLSVLHRGTRSLFFHLKSSFVENVADEAAFKDAFNLLLTELAFPKPGTPILAAALMKQCLIVLLRRYAEDGVCRAPWLAALEHPQLGAALEAMTAQPDNAFTLERMADLAGMSRAAFADHFKKAFGRSPMDVLRDIRLRRAAHMLAVTELPVKAIAAQVGFASRSHFSRVFTSHNGVTPIAFREDSRARTALEPNMDAFPSPFS